MARSNSLGMYPVLGSGSVRAVECNSNVVALIICANEKVLRTVEFEIQPRNVGVERCRSLGVEPEASSIEPVTNRRIIRRISSCLVRKKCECNGIDTGSNAICGDVSGIDVGWREFNATSIGI